MYGNYCGPWWSNGQWQTSVDGDLPAIDEFDETCKVHDFEYFSNNDLREADLNFYRSNIGKSFTRSVAAIAVGAQGYLRPKAELNRMTRKQQQIKKNLRTSQSAQTQVVTRRQNLSNNNDVVYAAPSSVATRRTGSTPKMNFNNASQSVVIKHRSFLGAINNSLNYEVTSYPLNPGLSSTFPWLNKLARRYEQYRFRSLRFEYRSVAPTSVGGVVMLSFDYDAADSAPATKAVQAQSIPNSECNAWMNNDLIVPAGGDIFRYIRSGALATNLDIKTYDLGQMFVSSVYGNNVTSGELYIEYEVELKHPTDGPEVGGTITTTMTASVLFSGTPVYTGVALPLVVNSTTQLLVTQTGEYFMTLTATATTSPTITTPTIISGASGSAITAMWIAGVGSTRTIMICKLRAQYGDIVSFPGHSGGSGLQTCFLNIGAAPYASIV